MNMILVINGHPISIIRKSDRLAYINALEKAQLGKSINDYEQIIIKSVNRSLNVYIKAAQGAGSISEENRALLKIGELAKRVGERNSTIRHWTKEGLLEIAEITQSGYQLYSTEMIERTKEINALKEKRFTLQEIKGHFNKVD